MHCNVETTGFCDNLALFDIDFAILNPNAGANVKVKKPSQVGVILLSSYYYPFRTHHKQTKPIQSYNFFTYKVFFRVISRLIASFVGASVIGHGILAGTYLAEYRDSLK